MSLLLGLGLGWQRGNMLSVETLEYLLFALCTVKPRPFRPHLAYMQVMYAYSSSCQLRHFQLDHCTVNDVISSAQVLSGDGIATRT